MRRFGVVIVERFSKVIINFLREVEVYILIVYLDVVVELV